jgi:hypothetical protein
MWLRITLVFRNGQGWELMEFSEPISELDDLEAEIYDPESILEVLTLAHVHCVPSEDLGFRLVEVASPPCLMMMSWMTLRTLLLRLQLTSPRLNPWRKVDRCHIRMRAQ